MRQLLRTVAIALSLAAVDGYAAGGPLVLPHERQATFIGVDTCGTADCHGAPATAAQSNVLMRERLVWENRDRHAKAFAALASETGQRIADNLGIGKATEARACLSCHSTDVPANLRGPKFRVNAGVTCESCHGPGGAFLKAHTKVDSTHAGNVAAGMYDTVDADARATLCLSCHQGDAKRRISHVMYGAGHPRLPFELDTFGVNQPYHFNVDFDYRQRKRPPSHLRLWAAGQLRAADVMIDNAIAPVPADSIVPELATFDCYGCHRPIPNAGEIALRPGHRPGQPSYVDAPLVLLRALASTIDSSRVQTLRNQTLALQSTLTGAVDTTSTAEALRTTLASLRETVRTRAEKPDDAIAVARAVATSVAAEQPIPFLLAEQAAMTVSTLVTAAHEAGRLADPAFTRVNKEVDRVYACVGDETAYRWADCERALTSFVAALP